MYESVCLSVTVNFRGLSAILPDALKRKDLISKNPLMKQQLRTVEFSKEFWRFSDLVIK